MAHLQDTVCHQAQVDMVCLLVDFHQLMGSMVVQRLPIQPMGQGMVGTVHHLQRQEQVDMVHLHQQDQGAMEHLHQHNPVVGMEHLQQHSHPAVDTAHLLQQAPVEDMAHHQVHHQLILVEDMAHLHPQLQALMAHLHQQNHLVVDMVLLPLLVDTAHLLRQHPVDMDLHLDHLQLSQVVVDMAHLLQLAQVDMDLHQAHHQLSHPVAVTVHHPLNPVADMAHLHPSKDMEHLPFLVMVPHPMPLAMVLLLVQVPTTNKPHFTCELVFQPSFLPFPPLNSPSS